ncbi:MAG: hypothetical protein LBF28_01190 [Rickettsiales bacterium]|nr:hypothetical protein [Rickettsiales bacterium]
MPNPMGGLFTSIIITSIMLINTAGAADAPTITNVTRTGSDDSGDYECTVTERCAAGTYNSTDGFVPCDTCADGKYSSAGATSCYNCDAGYYCANGIRTSCNAGYTSPAGSDGSDDCAAIYPTSCTTYTPTTANSGTTWSVSGCTGGTKNITAFSGTIQCATNGETYGTTSTPSGTGGMYCWCKATSVTTTAATTVSGSWVFNFVDGSIDTCKMDCAHQCVEMVQYDYLFQLALLSGLSI